MLNPEEAQARLKAVRLERGLERRLERVARLRGDARTVGRAVLRRDPKGEPFEGGRVPDQVLLDAWDRLDAFDAKSREALFEALLPGLGRAAERAWVLQQRLPYQHGWGRRAFRAPHNPNTSRPKRGLWLAQLLDVTEGYEQDAAWLAAWAPYLHWGAAYVLGPLLAAAVELGSKQGDAVFDVLRASALGEHPIGAMGRHVTSALLIAQRTDGWDLVERLLLAAQREEGLRQAVLETVDEAHPLAFRRMLHLILDHDLLRFSAAARAVDVWFGLQWDAANTRDLKRCVEQAVRLLDDPAARTQALERGDGQSVYLALWAVAYGDAIAAVEPASQILRDPNVERRFAAAHLLAGLGLIAAYVALLPAFGDADLRVVARAFAAFGGGVDERIEATDLFERMERALPRLPRKKETLAPILWPWLRLPAGQEAAADALLSCRGQRPARRLLPHLPLMSPQGRASAAEQLAKTEAWDADTREALLALVGDRSSTVREAAFRALATHTLAPGEAPLVEGLLARDAADLRRGVLSMLLRQPDAAALASAARLLDAAQSPQRAAGLDLLRQMAQAERCADACRALARRYQDRQPELPDAERALLGPLLDQERSVPTLDDALGLLDPARRTRPPAPRTGLLPGLQARGIITPAAVACLHALDGLVHQHRTAAVTIDTWEGPREELLGNLRWAFPKPQLDRPPEEDLARLPLAEVWQEWQRQRPPELRDADGLELLRALAPLHSFYVPQAWSPREPAAWLQRAQQVLFAGVDGQSLRYPTLVEQVLRWLLRLEPAEGAPDFLLDVTEAAFCLVPAEELGRLPQGQHGFDLGWRGMTPPRRWLELARLHRSLCPGLWHVHHQKRLWELLRWMEEPGPPVPRLRPPLEDVMAAYQAGAASEADILDQLLGPRPEGPYGGFRVFSDLYALTGRQPPPIAAQYPLLLELADRCRRRILEVELARGDLPTPATLPALALRSASGADTLFRLLRAMGRSAFTRGWATLTPNRAATLSHLVRITFPAEGDTSAAFAAQAAAARIAQARLVDLAVYAPQWAAFVEDALGWPGLEDGVWWMHAHTKGTDWSVGQEIRDVWVAQSHERTSLSAADLIDGAVDVAWFHTVYRQLGPERWSELDRAAEYASGGSGHKRAQVFADAMLGRLDSAELVARIVDKRHQDSVRALGLLPLAPGEGREADLLGRYQVLQEFLRTGRQFGSQRQASEKLAVRIGMDNLARTAGFPDPVRLEWAMEAREVADLAAGPVVASAGDVTLTLSIDEWGEPRLAPARDGKPLKAVPAAVRKEPAVVAVQARKEGLVRQASRMKGSLEQAMCRGDRFSGADLSGLFDHPLLAPLLSQVLFVGDGLAGYPAGRGRVLVAHGGREQPVRADDSLRIAHPVDLLATGEWHLWQRECFAAERLQPFKQVFRELYTLTAAERAEGSVSHRYAGHQVQPRQASALLGRRGWVVHPEAGVERAFHEWGIIAYLEVAGGLFTPAEVEGLTLEGVHFARRGAFKPLELEQVPPRLFSEVMRDLDLVVSVAHRGGVDPEATASTVEMRSALVRETCSLLQVGNVTLQGRHALIEGRLGSYSIHLGSAVVHRQPGGAVCIVPVHAQRRGRLFLPFADDDPKTAEVLSKVLLLARDHEIKDPTILEQLLVAP